MKLPVFLDRLFAPKAKTEEDGNIGLLRRVEHSLAGMAGQSAISIRGLLGGTSDEFYFWLLTDGLEHIKNQRLRSLLPSMPDEDTQAIFTGMSGKSTLEEAYRAYRLFKDIAARHSVDLDKKRTVLDFGCGWGRVIRFFLKDVEPSNLYGVDGAEKAIGICRQSNINAGFELINPLPPTNFTDNMFDLIYLYSVFSHLSENACLKWLAEFKRILRPGGIVIATTRRRGFITYCAEVRKAHQGDPASMRGCARAFLDTEKSLEIYDSGKFCFSSTDGSRYYDEDLYGEAAISKKYVEENWTRFFDVVEFIYESEHKVFGQNVIVGQKKRST